MCTKETSTSDAKLGSLAHVKLGDLSQLQFQEFFQGWLLRKNISEEEREIVMDLTSEGEDDEMTSEPVKIEPMTDLLPKITEEPGQTYSLRRELNSGGGDDEMTSKPVKFEPMTDLLLKIKEEPGQTYSHIRELNSGGGDDEMTSKPVTFEPMTDLLLKIKEEPGQTYSHIRELNSGGGDDEMASKPVKFDPMTELLPKIKEEPGQTYSHIRELNSGGGDDEMTSKPVKFEPTTHLLLKIKEEPGQTYSHIRELNSGGGDDEMTSKPVKFEPMTDLAPKIKEEPGQTYSLIRKRKLDFHKSFTEHLEEDVFADRASSTSYHDTNGSLHDANKRRPDFCQSFTNKFEEDQSTDISYFRIITPNEENVAIVPDLIEPEDTIYSEDFSCPERVKVSGWKEINLKHISEPKSSSISQTKIDKILSHTTHPNIGNHNNYSSNELVLQKCVSSNNSIQQNTRNQEGQEIKKLTNKVLPKNLTFAEKRNFQRPSTCTAPVQNSMSSSNPKSTLTRRVVSKLNPEVGNALSQTQRDSVTITSSTPAGSKHKQSRPKLRQILPKEVSSVQSSKPKSNVQKTTCLNQNNPSMKVTLTAGTTQNNSFTQRIFPENVGIKESSTPGQNANPVLNVIRYAEVAQNAMFTNSMSSTISPPTILQNVSPNLSFNLLGYIIPSQPQLPTFTNYVFNTPGFIVLPQSPLPCNQAPMLKTVLSTNQTIPASAVSTVTNTLSTGQKPFPVSTVPMLTNVLTTKPVMKPVKLNKQNNWPSKQPSNSSSVKNLRNVRSVRISDHQRSKLPATKVYICKQ